MGKTKTKGNKKKEELELAALYRSPIYNVYQGQTVDSTSPMCVFASGS